MSSTTTTTTVPESSALGAPPLPGTGSSPRGRAGKSRLRAAWPSCFRKRERGREQRSILLLSLSLSRRRNEFFWIETVFFLFHKKKERRGKKRLSLSLSTKHLCAFFCVLWVRLRCFLSSSLASRVRDHHSGGRKRASERKKRSRNHRGSVAPCRRVFSCRRVSSHHRLLSLAPRSFFHAPTVPGARTFL